MPIYMQLGSVPGTATDSDFTGWTVLSSCSWHIHVDIATTVGSATNRQGAGKITPSDVACTKEFCLSSVPILKLMFAGKPLDTAKIAVTQQATDNGEALITYTLHNVMISSFSQSSNSDGVPSDNFTLNFTQVEIKASPTNAKGIAQNSIGGYNFETSRPV